MSDVNGSRNNNKSYFYDIYSPITHVMSESWHLSYHLYDCNVIRFCHMLYTLLLPALSSLYYHGGWMAFHFLTCIATHFSHQCTYLTSSRSSVYFLILNMLLAFHFLICCYHYIFLHMTFRSSFVCLLNRGHYQKHWLSKKFWVSAAKYICNC